MGVINDTNKSDDQLLMAYVRGEQRAFEVLYTRHKQSLYAYFYRNCTPVAVDELFQEVWLRVVVSSKRYQPKNKFRSWLFTLAHNCLVDFYRKQSKRIAESENDVEKMAGAEGINNLENQRLARDIDNAVMRLPKVQREAFFLREESGFSIVDISTIQEVSVEAAKSRLRYAYEKLRVELKGVAT